MNGNGHGAEQTTVEGSVAAAAATAAAPVLEGGAGRGARWLENLPLGRLLGGTTLRSRVLRSSAWTLVGHALGHGMSLVSNLVLAALLFPEAFGVMALVRLVLRGLKMFSDVGIGPSIIQHQRGEDPAFLNTAWTIQVIRGVLLFVATCVLAWPASLYFQRSELIYLLPAAGVTSVISGFYSPALFTANRRLAMGRLTVMGVTTMFVGVVVSIVMAWATRSVWALLAGWYASSLLTLVLSHTWLPQERVRLKWERKAAGQLYRFGRWIFVSTMITFFARELDGLLLGKLLPENLFGVYAISMSVVLVPSAVCGHLAEGVLYPVLSEFARRDPALLSVKLKEAREVILPLAMFVVLGVVFASPVLFGHIYDDRYADAGWIGQMLGIPAWVTMLALSSDRAILALGETKWLALANFFKLLATAAAGYAGFVIGGLPGFILGMGVGTAVAHGVILVGLWRRGITLVWQDLRFTAAAAAAGLVGVFVPRLAAGGATVEPEVLPQIVVACLVLAPIGVWVLLSVKKRVVGS